jgi:hypothetical protein
MKILDHVRVPTLLIVGGEDHEVIALNQLAFRRLRSPKELVLVNRATQLFEEPGTLEEASRLVVSWFERYLAEPVSASVAHPSEAPGEIC